ncbi:MAG: helix-turn-helix domain-containing protein [Phycisphaeraceae bacterium]|nr:helix-turn-helix domain-containing protein [Phycisphaeraceae bacterium]
MADKETRPPADRMSDLDELAEAAQVSRRTLERLVAAGRIHAIRVGRLVRISPAERARFIAEGALPQGAGDPMSAAARG